MARGTGVAHRPQPVRGPRTLAAFNGETSVKKNLLILETDRSWSRVLRGADAVVSDARDADSEPLIDAAREPRVARIVCRIAADLRGGAPALAALALALACGAPLYGCSSQDAPPAISET